MNPNRRSDKICYRAFCYTMIGNSNWSPRGLLSICLILLALGALIVFFPAAWILTAIAAIFLSKCIVEILAGMFQLTLGITCGLLGAGFNTAANLLELIDLWVSVMQKNNSPKTKEENTPPTLFRAGVGKKEYFPS